MDRCRQRQFLYGFIFLLACGMWTGCPTEPDPPDVPSDIQLTASYNSITVSWSKNSDADQYQVFYRKGSTNADATLAGETAETSLTINDLEANTLYYITVRAGNSG